jgi:hypothetical protein
MTHHETKQIRAKRQAAPQAVIFALDAIVEKKNRRIKRVAECCPFAQVGMASRQIDSLPDQ